jgi:hypothetical protein
VAQAGFGDGDVDPGGQRAGGASWSSRRWLPSSAAYRPGEAVADGVAVLVDDGDFPARVRGAGRGGGEVAGQGGVEGSEEPVVAGAFCEPVQGG